MVWDEQGSGGGSAKIVFVPRTSQLTSRFAIFRAGLREGRHLERYTPPPQLQCFQPESVLRKTLAQSLHSFDNDAMLKAVFF
jgi:hypothetical protein